MEKAVDLVKEYRNLTPTQRRSVVETLKTDLKPKNFQGPKTEQRDFHNWYNKAAQVYYLLNQTVYFEDQNGELVLKEGKNSFIGTDTKLDRSLIQKSQYFENHKVEKVLGFELHHVVPLSWSENIHHFKILDRWENMIYIDAYNHAKITQNRNKNVLMDFIQDDMILKDYSKNEVFLKYKENISYEPTKKSVLKKYNFELLNTLK
jgi:hypothetical protein